VGPSAWKLGLATIIVFLPLLTPTPVMDPITVRASSTPDRSSLVASGPTTSKSLASSSATPASANATAALATTQTSAPLLFVQNVGQFDPTVRFQVRTGDATIWVTDDAIWITLLDTPTAAAPTLRPTLPVRPPSIQALAVQPETSTTPGRAVSPTALSRSQNPFGPLGKAGPPAGPRSGVNLKLSFGGANPHPRLEPLNRQSTRVSYLLGQDTARWHPDVPVWAGVRYHALVSGYDLEIRGDGGTWSWQLVAASDPASAGSDGASSAGSIYRLELQVAGAQSVQIDGDSLRLETPDGVLRLPLLQTAGTVPASVAVVTDAGSAAVSAPSNTTGLAPQKGQSAVAADTGGLLFSTYLGGSADGLGYGIAVDGSGDTYVTGYTRSPDFPTTPGVFQSTLSGGADAFVTKLNPSGTALVYSTYLGGSGDDWGRQIAVDGNGNAYVVGGTYSADFPTTLGAFQTTYRGNEDAVVLKLNPSGSGLLFSTYLGGSFYNEGEGIAVDAGGDAYVTGWTESADFPTTHGAFQTTFGGWSDVFVTKLNPSGSALVYSTYLGGYGYDQGYGIAVDASGDAYVTGSAEPENFPTTTGAFQTTCDTLDSDAFVTKLNASGTALLYSTCLGGRQGDQGGGGGDEGFDVAVDGSGDAYVTGYTFSTDFPTTPGAFQTTIGNYSDVFVTKLNSNGTGLLYSTYLGGSPDDIGNGIAVDNSGDAYVTGYTDSVTFPTTPGAFQTMCGCGDYAQYYDAFVTKLNPTGSSLLYSTFLGGSADEDGLGIAVDASGNAYVTGSTESVNFPTTTGAFQTTCSGCSDAFVTKLSPTVQFPPAITSAGAATFQVGAPGTFIVKTMGYPTPSLSESGALPTGLSFVDNHDGTATLSGTPAAGLGGVDAVTISAENGIAPDAAQAFSLIVNEAPSFTSATSATFTLGFPGSFTMTTHGYPQAGLSETGPLPTGVSFVNNQNGTATLSGTPQAGTQGAFGLTITASNGVSPIASQNFTLTVSQSPTDTATTTPTETPTDTATSTPTDTATSAPTDTATPTDTPTDTATATDTATSTPTDTAATSTPTDTATATPTDTATSTPTDTATPTNTPTDMATPTDSATNTPTDTATSTPTDTATSTPTDTATSTPIHRVYFPVIADNCSSCGP
jgi:Beta-propeller repeat